MRWGRHDGRGGRRGGRCGGAGMTGGGAGGVAARVAQCAWRRRVGGQYYAAWGEGGVDGYAIIGGQYYSAWGREGGVDGCSRAGFFIGW